MGTLAANAPHASGTEVPNQEERLLPALIRNPSLLRHTINCRWSPAFTPLSCNSLFPWWGRTQASRLLVTLLLAHTQYFIPRAGSTASLKCSPVSSSAKCYNKAAFRSAFWKASKAEARFQSPKHLTRRRQQVFAPRSSSWSNCTSPGCPALQGLLGK